MANVRKPEDLLSEADQIVAGFGSLDENPAFVPENHRVLVARARQFRRATALVLGVTLALNIAFLGWVVMFERAGFSAIDPQGGTNRLMVN